MNFKLISFNFTTLWLFKQLSQEQRADGQQLQQRYDDQRHQMTELRRELDELRLSVEDDTTEQQLRRATDELSTLRDRLTDADKQVRSLV